MQILLNQTYDEGRPSLLLYFEVAMNNRLFGHTLREVYLPFFARMSKQLDLNLIYVSAKVDKLEYFQKHNPPCDGIAVISSAENLGPPTKFEERFSKLHVSQLLDLNPVKLVALTTPLVLRDDIKRKTFDFMMNMKQSTMESINVGWVMLLGGMFLSNELSLPLDHVIVDPLESDHRDVVGFNNSGKRCFLYDSNIFGANALQIAESHYQLEHSRRLNQDKKRSILEFDDEKLDLLVGYSITQKPRLWLQNYDFSSLLDGSGLTHRICIKDNFKGIDTFVWDKEEYLALLRSSKFTVIIPSYEERAFSTIRFTEAIFNGAIPLILDRCNLTEAFSTEEQELLRPLTISKDNVVDVIRSIDYESMISKLQEYFLKDRKLIESI